MALLWPLHLLLIFIMSYYLLLTSCSSPICSFIYRFSLKFIVEQSKTLAAEWPWYEAKALCQM